MATDIDVYTRTHKTKQGLGDWISSKAKRVMESYEEICSKKKQLVEGEEGSIAESNEFDPESYVEAIEGPKKGVTFGISVTSFQGLISSSGRSGSSSSSMNSRRSLTREEFDIELAGRLSEQQKQHENELSQVKENFQQLQQQLQQQNEMMKRQQIQHKNEMKKYQNEMMERQNKMMEKMNSVLMKAGLISEPSD